MFELLGPFKKEVVNGKEFVLTKLPVFIGRKLIKAYFESNTPIIGKFSVMTSEDVARELISYVAINLGNNNLLRLDTDELVQNHIGDWENCVKLESAMLTYNCSFFQNGRAWSFLASIAQNLKELITQTLTTSSAPLSASD